MDKVRPCPSPLVFLLTRCSEEGARFPKSMCSSGVWAGAIPIEKAWDLRDIHDSNVTLKSELERHGFLGQLECSHTAYPLAAHFELHIEQGPILQETGRSNWRCPGRTRIQVVYFYSQGTRCAHRHDALECPPGSPTCSLADDCSVE